MALLISLYISTIVTSTLKKKAEDPTPATATATPTATATATATPTATATATVTCTESSCPTGRPAAVDAARARDSSSDEVRQTADKFDRALRFPEWWMGIAGLRGDIAALARGHVLEVAVGTGRNLAYYDWSGVVSADDSADAVDNAGGESGAKTVRSFTGVDISADMMTVARDRLREAVPRLSKLMRRRRAEPLPDRGGVMVDVLDSRVRLVLGDALEALPAPAAGTPAKYDTVLQTFGLCSVADPARLLANMASVVKPDTGRIVLLEHGRGWWGWVNGLLDRFAGAHFQRYGCWWNRDIEGLVRDAAAAVPGLEVVRVERPLLLQFGTTLFIELRVRSQQASRAAKKR